MSGIDFLNPWFLLLGLLGIPVVAAFLNKRRVVERTVPSLVLLRQLQAEEVTRRRFAIPNNLLALLLYLLALAGVVFASADPVI
ncbi:MAG: BatA domain-containing protein, partial [Myxococcota bacterium]|nr:BatA domain-containing protein [Myxococcota bacterium]